MADTVQLYVFVEGPDDERFFSRVLKEPLLSKFADVQFIKHVGQKAEKVDRYIKSIKSMSAADYVFTEDFDRSKCFGDKKRRIKKKFKNIDDRRIVIVKREIECWYLAGLNNATLKSLRMHRCGCTDDLTKEQFCSMKPKRFLCESDFKMEILNCYSVDEARRKNRSFRYFWDRYIEGGLPPSYR